jgi:two-component system, cell cycle sensor histidine kinase and response regulator CckA
MASSTLATRAGAHRLPRNGARSLVPPANLCDHYQDNQVRHRAERAQYRALFNGIPYAMFGLDADGRVTAANAALQRLTGCTHTELAGKSWRELVHPDDVARCAALLTEVVAGRPQQCEFRLLHAGGESVPVRCFAAPLTVNGRYIGVHGSIEDVAAEQRAADGLAYLSMLLDTVGEAVIATDMDGSVVFWNSFAEQLYGWTREEALGRHVIELTVPEQTRALAANIIDELMRTDSWAGEVLLARRDGSEFVAYVTDTLLRDAAGTPTGIVGVSTDMTERKRLEAGLQQAQKLEAIGRLAGGVAHDFNNILTAIVGHTELAIGDLPTGSQAHDDLSAVRTATQRAAALTRQLLAFSRNQVARRRLLDPRQVVIGLEPMLRRLITEDVELVVDAGDVTGSVHADPIQVEQIVMNLVVNARDALPAGGRITIVLREQTMSDAGVGVAAGVPAGRYLSIAVSDDGTGIAPDVLPHIFDPFFTTKSKHVGTGLGLSTVHGIVQQSGGHVLVETVPGAGTTFRVPLPRIDGDADADTMAAGAALRGTERVLLVEDDDAVRAITERALRRLGYTVITAATGDDALELCTGGHCVDLVLTDVVMPGISGYELARELRRRRPDIAVILMSGYSADHVLGNDADIPADTILEKPFSPDTLGRAVRQRLDAVMA